MANCFKHFHYGLEKVHILMQMENFACINYCTQGKPYEISTSLLQWNCWFVIYLQNYLKKIATNYCNYQVKWANMVKSRKIPYSATAVWPQKKSNISSLFLCFPYSATPMWCHKLRNGHTEKREEIHAWCSSRRDTHTCSRIKDTKISWPTILTHI